MWDGLWIWGNILEESHKGLDIDQFGRTEVDGMRRSLRIANKDQNLIKAREESISHNALLIKERGEAEYVLWEIYLYQQFTWIHENLQCHYL